MSRFAILIIATAGWLPIRATAAEPVVVCHGDSITKGANLPPDETYPAVLGTLLANSTVRNAGIGGNTSRAGLARLQEDVLAAEPDAVVLLFGTNDSVLTDSGRFRVPVDTYEKNLTEMVQRCRDAGAEVVLCTLLPIASEPYFTRHPKRFYDENGGLSAILDRYRAASIRVGNAMQIEVVDLYADFQSDLSLLRPAPDGVHPNAKGARRIAELVAARLKQTPIFSAPAASPQ